MIAYGYAGQPAADFELDHLISLELGGAPRDAANLWPEPWTGTSNARQKDVVENFLNREVCRGTIQLVEAATDRNELAGRARRVRHGWCDHAHVGSVRGR